MSDPNRKLEKAARAAEQQARYDAEVAGLEFKEWPKISRLNRDVVITEKIDGTNSAIGIVAVPSEHEETGPDSEGRPVQSTYRVYAQSRTRIITPEQDNYGFAAWVKRNEKVLVETLGEGLHFGEWWGVGIQRGYGMSERRFSLFNTAKWGEGEGAEALGLARVIYGLSIYSVPVLYSGPWLDLEDIFSPWRMIWKLQAEGSLAAPGFMSPEGVVVYHRASGQCFKATVEGDDEHKGAGLPG